jgi:hypothetical protein
MYFEDLLENSKIYQKFNGFALHQFLSHQSIHSNAFSRFFSCTVTIEWNFPIGIPL